VENQESESEGAQPKVPFHDFKTYIQETEPQARRDRFRDYYMEMLTAEFGDDLDGLRMVCCSDTSKCSNETTINPIQNMYVSRRKFFT